jgi:hypothetical protein
MKKNSLLLFICLAYLSAYVFEGCRKEKIDEYEPDRPFQHIPESTTPSPVMTTSFIEDFNETDTVVNMVSIIRNSAQIGF